MQGWQIVQQLAANKLDSWERIFENFRVHSVNDEAWSVVDEEKVAAFCQACPLLGTAKSLACCILSFLLAVKSKYHAVLCLWPNYYRGLVDMVALLMSNLLLIEELKSNQISFNLTGHDLATQLAAQAALFMRAKEPQALNRGHSGRMGSLRDRIDRLYLQERAPSTISRVLSLGLGRSFHQAGAVPKTTKLIPLMEAVQHAGFCSTATWTTSCNLSRLTLWDAVWHSLVNSWKQLWLGNH